MTERRPSPWSTVNKVITLISVLTVCGTLLAFLLTWRSTEIPVGPIKDVGRTVTRMEQPRKEGVPANEADAKDIAAAAIIDCEGERVDLLGACRLELIDITLRAKKRLPDLSYRQIVAKALTWVPDDWKYPARWQDRDTVSIEMARTESVKELFPIVMKRMRDGPGDGCAAKIIRAKWHFFGWAGGEDGAANIIRTYPKDPRFEANGFLTDFRCLPK